MDRQKAVVWGFFLPQLSVNHHNRFMQLYLRGLTLNASKASQAKRTSLFVGKAK